MLNADIRIYPVAILKDNYVWIIVNLNSQHAIIVDPGDATPVVAFLNQHRLIPQAILITHHHWDHTNGVSDLLTHYKMPVFGANKTHSKFITNPIHDMDIVYINDSFPSYTVLSIPGHTLDHVAYYAEHTLFCGDTLFAAGCGKAFEGTAEQLYASLQRLASLPDDTKIYCAHEYTVNNLRFAKEIEPVNSFIKNRIDIENKKREKNIPTIPSTLAEEKRTNPFLRCHIKEVIYNAEKHAGHALENPAQVFSVLREWKNNFS
jgi:hydroxyacylglutathione hydrolase